MVFHTTTSLFLTFTLLALLTNAHFFESWPIPRVNKVNYNAPGCESKTVTIPEGNVFETGSWFVPRHGKTNHNGGFDLYSLVKLQPDPSVEEMIKDDNIFHMECQTLNCVTADMNQGGVYVDDQESLENSCWGSGFYWPNTPGEFTMFWYNYGSFGSQGVEYLQLPVYSNCANIRLIPSKQNSSAPKCTFGGGDATLFWDGRRPSNHECAYKRFNNPPSTSTSTKDAIEGDNKVLSAPDKNGNKHLPQANLDDYMKIGVPDMVKNGKCNIIKEPMKITKGPYKGNKNAMPQEPPGGYTYL